MRDGVAPAEAWLLTVCACAASLRAAALGAVCGCAPCQNGVCCGWQARAASEGAQAAQQAGYLKAAANGVMSKASTVCPPGAAGRLPGLPSQSVVESLGGPVSHLRAPIGWASRT